MPEPDSPVVCRHLPGIEVVPIAYTSWMSRATLFRQRRPAAARWMFMPASSFFVPQWLALRTWMSEWLLRVSIWFHPHIQAPPAVTLQTEPRSSAACWEDGRFCFHFAKKKYVDCSRCGLGVPTCKATMRGAGQVRQMCGMCFWETRTDPLIEWCPCPNNERLRDEHLQLLLSR